MSRSSFTLIELLVVIAILAILSVAIVIVINPADLIRQSRDTNRLTDLNQLNKAISLFDVTNSDDFVGTSTVVYVSLSDSTTTCANLSLPTLPAGYIYNCVTSSTLNKVDGTGWIPINFNAISYGSPIQKLPIDPINTTSSGQYYSYIPGGSWELNGSFESEKYRADPKKAKTNLPGVISIGTNLSLNPSYREPATGQNQTLGTDLLAGWDLTSGWSVANSGSIDDANNFHNTSSTNGYVYKSILVVGTRYRATFSGTSSGLLRFANTNPTTYGTITSGGAFTNISIDFTAVNSNVFAFYTNTNYPFTATITSMTLKAITQESGSLTFDVMNNTGTIQDIAGNKTVTNTAVSVPNINHNNVMEFNGSTSKLDLGADFIGTGDYSVAGWIYAAGWGEGTIGTIVDNGKFKFTLVTSGSKLRFSSDGATTVIYSAASSISLGNWYHVAVTRTSNGTTNFYINGILSGTANQSSGTPAAGTTNVTIGNNSAQSASFDGYIYRLKGYNRILSTTEIQQLFNNQRFLFGI